MKRKCKLNITKKERKNLNHIEKACRKNLITCFKRKNKSWKLNLHFRPQNIISNIKPSHQIIIDITMTCKKDTIISSIKNNLDNKIKNNKLLKEDKSRLQVITIHKFLKILLYIKEQKFTVRSIAIFAHTELLSGKINKWIRWKEKSKYLYFFIYL